MSDLDSHDRDILDSPDQDQEDSNDRKGIYLNLLLFVLLSGANFLILYTVQQFWAIDFTTLVAIGFGIEVILLLTVGLKKSN